MDYRIFPPEEILECTVSLPASKSVAARNMVMDFIAGQTIKDTPASCDDLTALATALEQGFSNTELDMGGSGTALRFVCALAAATPGGDCRISGDDSLRARPADALVESLRALGADIEYTMRQGFPPLHIRGRKLCGGRVAVDISAGTQAASALMLASPLMSSPVSLELKGRPEIPPFIKLTAAMMRRRGVDVDTDALTVNVGSGMYKKVTTEDEPDWSAAAFWYEIAAISAGFVSLRGLKQDSAQPDRGIAELFSRLGVDTEFEDGNAELAANPDLFGRLDADLSGMPDAVPALAVTCVMTGIPFTLTGVGALKYKESNRLAVLRDELEALGVELSIENYDTVIQWDGNRRPIATVPVFNPHGDHRMAMAFAPVSIFLPGIVIKNAECVSKSYPGFWDDLRNAGFRLLDPSEPIPQQQ